MFCRTTTSNTVVTGSREKKAESREQGAHSHVQDSSGKSIWEDALPVTVYEVVNEQLTSRSGCDKQATRTFIQNTAQISANTTVTMDFSQGFYKILSWTSVYLQDLITFCGC